MKRNIIRQLYLYAVSIISLFLLVFAGGQIVNLGLKTWVFTLADSANMQRCDESGNVYYGGGPVPAKPVGVDGKSTEPTMTAEEKATAKATCVANLDEQRRADKQRELVSALSMLIVGAPVFWFHFKLVQKERDEDKDLAGKEPEKRA